MTVTVVQLESFGLRARPSGLRLRTLGRIPILLPPYPSLAIINYYGEYPCFPLVPFQFQRSHEQHYSLGIIPEVMLARLYIVPPSAIPSAS